MKKILNYTIAIFTVLSITSCSITVPFFLTNNPIVSTKKGVSTTVCLFSGGVATAGSAAPMQGKTLYNGIMLNKDFGIYEAAKNAKLTKIATVDLRTDWYFLFTRKTFIVTGE